MSAGDAVATGEDAASAVGNIPSRPLGVERGIVRRLLRHPVGMLTIGWLAVVVFVALTCQWITPYDPRATDARNALLAPGSDGHLLGTDEGGRDILSRLLAASQASMLAVLLTVGIALLIGVTLGLIGGYFSGGFDQASSWVSNLIMAMPGVVLLLAARTVVGPSIVWAMAIFGIILSPVFYRLVSANVRVVREELYVDAARVSGISDSRIVASHVLRVVRGPIIIQASIVCSIAIAVLAGLPLIGFGDINTITWGQMLNSGFDRIFNDQTELLWPALVISLTSLSFALLGSLLHDELDSGAPHGHRRRRALGGTSATLLTPTFDATLTGAGVAAVAERGPVLTELEVRMPPSSTGVTIEHILPEAIDPLLSVRNLVVGYPGPTADDWVLVVRGVDLDVGRGEVLGLVGESGSGKTQTAFAVMGLLGVGGEILGGSIEFDGQQLVDNSKAARQLRGRRIGYVPQEPMSNLDPTFTVGSQLVEPLRVCLGLDKQEAKRRAIELLDRVHIPNPERVFDSYPHQLSGGMAQRVLIAGAVASKPDLIIADEPTTALDVTVQAEILDLLRELQRDLDTSLLLVTHNFGVVADVA
ncbi:MAG TPA: dipeptide/oligopeptide/nickel ABC transporter permease/ATP-binding protein, partial [Ilumatobacteraceae bacterium]|nr:dipeptide/oligopeptide/nickel ABC transporter permease/ATP-binding protein [Ilumatobacteraceae bacterium]